MLRGVTFHLDLHAAETPNQTYSQLVRLGACEAPSHSEATHVVTRSRRPRAKAPAVAVLPEWVEHCGRAQTTLDPSRYAPQTWFGGVVVHVPAGAMAAEAAAELYALVERGGGQFAAAMSPMVTHIVGPVKTENDAPTDAVHVSPLYFGLAAFLERRLWRIPAAYLYSSSTAPLLRLRDTRWRIAPSLLEYLNPSGASAASTNPIGALLVRSLEQLEARGALVVASGPSDFCLADTVARTVELPGESTNGPTPVTVFWLAAVLESGTAVPPDSSVFYQPAQLHRANRSQLAQGESTTLAYARMLANCRATVSGYSGAMRLILQHALVSLGARFTGTLEQSNTHVVCNDPDSLKARTAQKWGLHVVNHVWVEQCLERVSASISATPAAETSSPLATLFDADLVDALSPPALFQPPSPADTFPDAISARAAALPSEWSRGFVPEELLAKSQSQAPTDSVRIAFTGYEPSESDFQGVEKLGGACWKRPADGPAPDAQTQVSWCSHLVTPQPQRTEKLLMAVGLGRAIVRPDWIAQSLAAGRWLPEDAFAVGASPSNGAPRLLAGAIERARQRAADAGVSLLPRDSAIFPPPLLASYQVYVLETTVPSPRLIERLAAFVGATVLAEAPSTALPGVLVTTHAANASLCGPFKDRGFRCVDWDFFVAVVLQQSSSVRLGSFLL